MADVIAAADVRGGRSSARWGALTFFVALLATNPGARPVSYHSPAVSVGEDATTFVLETATLPLRVTTDPLFNRSTLAVGAGAIAAIGGRVVILDRLGRLFVYDHGRIAEDTCPRLPMDVAGFERAGVFPLDESTLRSHDLLYDAATRSLFSSFERFDEDSGTTHFEIARIGVDADGRCAGGWDPVLKGPPLKAKGYYSGRGAGGKMALDGDDLYFAVGDYNLDKPSFPAAQLPDSFFGKSYRYDLGTKRLDVLSSGHRVPLGLALDASKRLWMTENGPRGGDKLDLIKSGQNYGWPFTSIGTRYFRYSTAALTTATEDDFTKPAFAWVPSIAPSQVSDVEGFDERWNGDLLVGSLKAQTLYRLHLDGDRVAYSEPIRLGHRIRDFLVVRGQIVILTDDGSLMTLSPEYALLRKGTINVEAAYRHPELGACSACHSLSAHSQTEWAPNLAGVFGRAIGGSQFDHYSQAMTRKGGSWDDASLAAFLLDPAAFIPGTTMPGVQLTPELVGKIVEDLKEASVSQRLASRASP